MTDIWGMNGFVANHFTSLVIIVAASGSAITVYLRTRARKREAEGLCPRCGTDMVEGISDSGWVCRGCSPAARRDGLVAFSLFLAGAVVVGLLLVAIVWGELSEGQAFPWSAFLFFGPLEFWLVRGATVARAQVKQGAA